MFVSGVRLRDCWGIWKAEYRAGGSWGSRKQDGDPPPCTRRARESPPAGQRPWGVCFLCPRLSCCPTLRPRLCCHGVGVHSRKGTPGSCAGDTRDKAWWMLAVVGLEGGSTYSSVTSLGMPLGRACSPLLLHRTTVSTQVHCSGQRGPSWQLLSSLPVDSPRVSLGGHELLWGMGRGRGRGMRLGARDQAIFRKGKPSTLSQNKK